MVNKKDQSESENSPKIYDFCTAQIAILQHLTLKSLETPACASLIMLRF